MGGKEVLKDGSWHEGEWEKGQLVHKFSSSDKNGTIMSYEDQQRWVL